MACTKPHRESAFYAGIFDADDHHCPGSEICRYRLGADIAVRIALLHSRWVGVFLLPGVAARATRNANRFFYTLTETVEEL